MESLSSSTNTAALLTIICVISHLSPILAIQHQNSAPTYTKFIKTSCKATHYPDLCYKSLSTHASAIQTSPKMLATTAISVTLNKTRSTTEMISKMSNDLRIRPREASALRDCLDLLNDAVSELQESMKDGNEIKGSHKLGHKMNDIKTWVSAVMTDEDTCMIGFSGKAMDGKIKSVIRGAPTYTVAFRMVMFRPYVGEVIGATLKDSNKKGLQLSLGFFDDIYIPSYALPFESKFQEHEDPVKWVWYHEDTEFPIDEESEIRFRVTSVEYPQIPLEQEEGSKPFAPMVVTGTLNSDGLGPISWWV